MSASCRRFRRRRARVTLADRVGSWVTIMIDVTLVICMLSFRNGFIGELIVWQQRRRSK